MLSYRTNLSQDEYQTFCEQADNFNFLQAYDWAKLKTEWKSIKIGIYDDQKLVMVALILKRKIAKIFNMAYIARGPIGAVSNLNYLAYFLKCIKEICGECDFIKLDLNFIQSSNDIINPKSIEIMSLLQGQGFKAQPSDKMEDQIQAIKWAIVDLTKDFAQIYNKTASSEIKRAYKFGLEVEHQNIKLLDSFARLVKDTEKRKSVKFRDREYFAKLINSFPNNSLFTMIKLNIPQSIKEMEENLAIVKNQDSAKFIVKHLNFLKNYPIQDTVYIAGMLSLYDKNNLETLYAASSNDFQLFYATLFAYHQQYLFAKDQGIKQAILGGVENKLDGGLYRFKSKFRPRIDKYIGEYNYPNKKLKFYLFNIMLKIKKSIDKIKN